MLQAQRLQLRQHPVQALALHFGWHLHLTQFDLSARVEVFLGQVSRVWRGRRYNQFQ